MVTQQTHTTYSQEYQNYSFEHACVVCVPIILKVPLSVEPIVMPNNPVCQKQNGYKQYDKKLATTS